MEPGSSKHVCSVCLLEHGPGVCPYVTPEKSEPELSQTPQTPLKPKVRAGKYKDFVCEICQKNLSTKGKLTLHMTLHTGERRYSCQHCGKGFDSRFKLVRHMLVHSHRREWVCEACGTGFRRKDHLEAHAKHHCGDRTIYPCEECDKKYSCMGSLRKHKAVHSAQSGNLNCLLCAFIANDKDEILAHIRTHSSSRLSKTGADRKYRCTDCDRSFSTRKDARRHSVVHTKRRDWLCEFCPRTFGRSDHLSRHIEKAHTSAQQADKNLPSTSGQNIEDPSNIPSTSNVLPGFDQAFRDV